MVEWGQAQAVVEAHFMDLILPTGTLAQRRVMVIFTLEESVIIKAWP
jgi:hypothetical protein